MSDPYNLQRFVDAQQRSYPQALQELRDGHKRSHWIWYILPQLEGLGHSAMAREYGIGGRDEARAYLDHPLLGARLRECCEALLAVQGRTARQILGSPDDLKLRSCATLFAQVAPPGSPFERLLERYYGGEADHRTLQLLA